MIYVGEKARAKFENTIKEVTYDKLIKKCIKSNQNLQRYHSFLKFIGRSRQRTRKSTPSISISHGSYVVHINFLLVAERVYLQI